MIKLRIDNKELEAPEGSTILEIAAKVGISIPVLCHKEGVAHYTSCMVCMVKDNNIGSYLPSCSALIQAGMDIDTSGEEIVKMRKKAIELLLSEHRAECEAPCKLVCPAGLNIPVMNRFLAKGDFESAVNLSVAELRSTEIHCQNCPGYCENACRRKKIDTAISIKNIQLIIHKSINKDKIEQIALNQESKNEELTSQISKSKGIKRRFSSHIGRIDPLEINEWLKEAQGATERFREIQDVESAKQESAFCMHCDCRAVDDCRLRELAEEFSVKDPREKLVYAPVMKKINLQTDLIYENAKCIKCGLCVRICEDSRDEPALCFLNRGFVSIISEPLTHSFEDILKTKTEECIEVCPTGALAYFK